MLLILCIFSWTLSLIFMFLKHPLSLGLILLLQTISISMISGLLNSDFWFSYILFLIMIGGMLVLFIYMTSVASDEKFKFSKKLMLLNMIFVMISLLLIYMDNYYTMINLSNKETIIQDLLNINLSMNKYMNMPSMMIMIMLMIYLLVTLIMTVKITHSLKGPLRTTL